jgi:transcriptional regulator with XRE-family HTH domain
LTPIDRAGQKRLRILGRTVYDLRTYQDLSMTELGALSGIHRSSISRIEHGKAGSPGIEILTRVATALAVPVCRLFEQSHIPPDMLHVDEEMQSVLRRFRGLSAKVRAEARTYLTNLA